MKKLKLLDLAKKYYERYEPIVMARIALRKKCYDLINGKKYKKYGIKSVRDLTRLLDIPEFGPAFFYALSSQWYYVKYHKLSPYEIAKRYLWKKIYIVSVRVGLDISKEELLTLAYLPRDELYKFKSNYRPKHSGYVEYEDFSGKVYPELRESFLEDTRKFIENARFQSVEDRVKISYDLCSEEIFSNYGIRLDKFVAIIDNIISFRSIYSDYDMYVFCKNNNISIFDSLKYSYFKNISTVSRFVNSGKYIIKDMEKLKKDKYLKVLRNKFDYLEYIGNK